MKLLRYFALIVGVVSMLGISDCDRTPPELTELEKLPPATQVGKYTFGCLVNGRAMVPDNTLEMTATYQFNWLQIIGTARIDDSWNTLNFFIVDPNVLLKTYMLDDSVSRRARFVYSDDNIICDIRTNGTDKNTGTLTITKFDHRSLIVSGTFEVTLSQDGCPTYVITDGRFDLPFIP